VALSVPPTAAPPQLVAVATVVQPTTGAKFAVTMVLVVTASVHGLVPEQPPPDQPVKAEPVAGVAVRTTLAVGAKEAAQVAPQSMLVVAAGVDVDATVPVPSPARTMVKVLDGSEKVAVTVVAAASATVQVLVPEHPPPDQPTNTEPVAAAAVRTTLAPLLKDAEQVVPHEIPAGFDVTVPVPPGGLWHLPGRVFRSCVDVLRVKTGSDGKHIAVDSKTSTKLRYRKGLAGDPHGLRVAF